MTGPGVLVEHASIRGASLAERYRIGPRALSGCSSMRVIGRARHLSCRVYLPEGHDRFDEDGDTTFLGHYRCS